MPDQTHYLIVNVTHTRRVKGQARHTPKFPIIFKRSGTKWEHITGTNKVDFGGGDGWLTFKVLTVEG